MKIFSLDLGNKQTKLVSEKGIKVLPSHFLDYESLGDQSTSLFNQNLKISKYEASFDNMFTYAWGEDLHKVHSEDNFFSTISFEDRYQQDEFRLLANFAIGELARDFPEASEGILEVVVITGVPTDDFNAESVKDIMKVLKGDHNIIINDISLNVRVKEVLVLPQPIGTVYHEMLDKEGYMNNDGESFLEEQVTVVDIGGGTLLIDTLKNMNLDHTTRIQRRTGAYEVYDRIVNITTKNGIKGITSYEIEQILREGNEDEGYYYKPNKNESFNITDTVIKEKIKYTREIINTINTTLKGTSKIDTLLFTGGGSHLIKRNEVQKKFKFARFSNDSETANANGFYKYGVATLSEKVGG